MPLTGVTQQASEATDDGVGGRSFTRHATHQCGEAPGLDQVFNRGFYGIAASLEVGVVFTVRQWNPSAVAMSIDWVDLIFAGMARRDPWIGSNMAYSSPTLQPTAVPLHRSTDARSVTVSPNILVVTNTS